MMRSLACLCVFLSAVPFITQATPPSTNILNESVGQPGHANDFIAPAINAVSSGQVDTTIFVDYNPVVSIPAPKAADLTNTLAAYTSVASGLTVNHAPYLLANCSCPGYNAQYEFSAYASYVAAPGTQTIPLALRVNPALPAGTQPPALFIVSSSPNSTNGGSGWGIEIGVPANYKGLNTTADSWVSAAMSGFTTVLQLNHFASYNIWDIKAALRVTASNWSTGYDHTQFGYGLINWDAANSNPTLYLQPPVLTVKNNQWYAIVTLSPFFQTRHHHEVVYSIPANATLPLKNEYTSTDIANLGGTLIYTSNGTDIQPTFTYTPAASGTVTFFAATADALGNFSRGEAEFSKVTQTFLVGSTCGH